MRKRFVSAHFMFLLSAILGLSLNLQAAQQGSNDDLSPRRMQTLKEEIRHELVMLPYYSVFDWLTAEVKADGTVKLHGQVTRPTLKSDSESRVKRLEGVNRLVNNIEVLPLSTADNEIRIATYRAIFSYNSPLFRYGTQAVPPIHIIVKNGRVWLKGVVATEMDSQLAYTAARQVSGVFEVNNELQIEGRTDQKISRR